MGGGENNLDETQALIAMCRAKAHIYSLKEVEFLRSIAGPIRRELTPAQMKWLRALADREPIDFAAVNRDALAVLHAICQRWMPDGKLQGKEFVALNPTRGDSRPGSFSVNIHTGKWGDFASGDRGGDPISLAAYLFHGGDQIAAALDLKRMLGA